ncbi:membrane protein [Devosia pacifica]|uniref:Membrane protein n=1 Tax=Devosia pacifica TaxID=1335967 RepID=A0A918SDD0_9HYPH|nr:CopD family protein [Devosia pacifica]GHA34663.1 membrane protein [Devosia pacifica]
MTVLILKFVHLAAIAVWAGGLISLPFIYNQRAGLKQDALFRLHLFTRFFYVALVSPAAFVAIASGTALIFVQATFMPWFSLKLLLVAAMTLAHILCGLTILWLFEPEKAYPGWRAVTMTSAVVLIVSGILFIVLGKPSINQVDDFNGLFQPGELGRIAGNMFEQLTAWSI